MRSSTESHDTTGEQGSVLESLSCSRFKIAGEQFNPAIECRNHQRKAAGHLITSSAQTIRRFSRRTRRISMKQDARKNWSSAQETKEAPCNEEVHGGEEIKGEW